MAYIGMSRRTGSWPKAPSMWASSGSIEPEGVGEEIILEGLRDLAPAFRRGDRCLPQIGHRRPGEQHHQIEWLRLVEQHLEVEPPRLGGWKSDIHSIGDGG